MRKGSIYGVLLSLFLLSSTLIWADDLAAVRKALEAKYALTTTTADKTDIVTPGCVLVLKKNNLVTTSVGSRNLYQNTYKNGQINQNVLGRLDKLHQKITGDSGTADRTFVTGEKVWVTGIEVSDKQIVFRLYTDAFQDVRYGATLTFPFAKGATPTESGALATIAEVFSIQPSDNDSGQQQTADAQQGPQAGANQQHPATAPAPAPAQSTETAPPPIAPPPPPPADPKTISLGQSPEQIKTILGQPEKDVKLGNKEIYYYKDMKVTFVSGKMTAAE